MLDMRLGGPQLRGCPGVFGIDPTPFGLFYGILIGAVDHPRGRVVMKRPAV